MKNFVFSTIALAAVLIIPNVASADETSDRTAAIQLCRTEVSAQLGQDGERVRLDQVRVRPRTVRVDLDVWRHGQLENVRCEVARSDLTIASITPTLQSASTATLAAQ